MDTEPSTTSSAAPTALRPASCAADDAPRPPRQPLKANRDNDCEQPPVGKRLRPTVKQEVGWGPFDEDGFRLDASA